MATFIIDGYDFGVDHAASQIDISSDCINISIVGQQDRIEPLWDIDDHPWSWLVYPPKIYLDDVPITFDEDGFDREITDVDLEEYDIAPCGKLLSVLGCSSVIPSWK